METHIVRLSGRSLGTTLKVVTEDIFNGPLVIDPQEFDFFCGHSAINFVCGQGFADPYVFEVDVWGATEPLMQMEMVVDTVIGADAAKTVFRRPTKGVAIEGSHFLTAADFAVAWGERFMATPLGQTLHGMHEADAVLTIRSAYAQAMAPYDPFSRMTPIGGNVEMNGESVLTHIAEMIEFMDGSVAYFSPEGLGYNEPAEALEDADDSSRERQPVTVRDTSPMESHEMVSFMTH